MHATHSARLPQLEPLGDATQLAPRIHARVSGSMLLESFDLDDIRLLTQFMQAYRAEPGQEVMREGEAGDHMMVVVDGRVEVFRQDRWNAPRLIAVVEAGKTLGEMSMIDGEPRFATGVAAEQTVVAVLTRETLARLILEQPILGAKLLMELASLLSQRLRHMSDKLMGYLDKQRELQESVSGPTFV